MADLPIEKTETVDKKEVPLTLEERVARNEGDILELARGVNTQAQLLEGMITAFDHVIKTYLRLIQKPAVKPTVPPAPEKK